MTGDRPATSSPSTACRGRGKASTRLSIDSPVDGAQLRATRAQYDRAAAIARSKGVHVAPPGVLEFRPRTGWYEPVAVGDCGHAATRDAARPRWTSGPSEDAAAQLRSVYGRIVVPIPGRSTWEGGKAKWVPVGIVCRKCGAFWAQPND
jgi:hypothetical protein